jgi:hypothetical protein
MNSEGIEPKQKEDDEMKPLDLKDIYNGLMTIIIIILSVGQYSRIF